MSPSRGVRIGACLTTLLALIVFAPAARAQMSFEEASFALDPSPDPLARSPRLVGMGRLTLVIPDANNRLTLWDFAGNPVGALDSDSISTFEFRPNTSSLSESRDFVNGGLAGERQDAAARATSLGYEFWRRAGTRVAFGAVGDLSTLNWDRAYDDSREVRSRFSVPNAMPVLTGQFPFFARERMRYALRGIFANEIHDDEYRLYTVNAAGQYLDHDGGLLGPPNYFDPDERDVNRVGMGLALSYRVSPSFVLAVDVDGLRDRIKGRNEAGRYLSQRDESRPYGIGQVSAVGRIGPNFEYGLDARGWKSSSDAHWVFTFSQGAGARPVIGRGDLYDREEEGSRTRARVRWTSGALEFGGSYGTGYGHYEITTPPLSDLASFNHFLNDLYNFATNDSLALPDSLRSNTVEHRSVNYAGGVSYRLRHGIVGVEYHWLRDLQGDDFYGAGPRRILWDVRAGLEHVLTPVLTGRAGYLYRSDDRDDETEQNAFVSHTATAGLGLKHPGSRWGLEASYAFEWGIADFGTPSLPRSTRQQLAAGLRWSF